MIILLLKKANKGCQIVLIGKKNIILIMSVPVLQEGPYFHIKKDQTISLVIFAKKVIKNSVILNNVAKRSITPTSTICARFYALRKVHKINKLLRTIVTNIGTATYLLSKFLASIFPRYAVLTFKQ